MGKSEVRDGGLRLRRDSKLRRADRRESGFRRGRTRPNWRDPSCSHPPPSPISRLGLKTALEFAHVRECSQLLGITVPAGVAGEYIVVKHALKETDEVIAVLQDQDASEASPAKALTPNFS